MVEPGRDTLDFRPWMDCWQCGGCGSLPGCFEDCCSGADCDPEDPEYCCAPSRCDVCGGHGGWHGKEDEDPS